MMEIKELESKHELYKRWADRWKYLEDSYEGGEDYERAMLLYRYVYEATETGKYKERIRQTPLDNQCESVIHTYSSFVWRQTPQRDLGRLKNNFECNALLEDADLEGTPFNEFMRMVQIKASIFGHAWLVIDKAAKRFRTLQEERRAGARPYVLYYSPLDVWDWRYERNAAGAWELALLKYVEVEHDKAGRRFRMYHIWRRDWFGVYRVQDGTADVETVVEGVNELGLVPAVCHYNKGKRYKGVGVSDIKDVAKMQQSIYNSLSELDQTIRNTNHTTLVKNRKDETAGGAGGVVIMDEETEPQKKPYLLQPQLFQMEGLLKAIEKKEDMINHMTHLSPVRKVRTQPVSGVAIQTEFQLLNALLTEKAAALQMTEYRLLRVFFRWIGRDADEQGVAIHYPAKFELRDRETDLRIIEQSKKLKVQSETFYRELDKRAAAVALEDDESLEKIIEEIEKASYAGMMSVADGEPE